MLPTAAARMATTPAHWVIACRSVSGYGSPATRYSSGVTSPSVARATTTATIRSHGHGGVLGAEGLPAERHPREQDERQRHRERGGAEAERAVGQARGDERAREDGEQRRLDRVALSSSHHSRLRSSQLNLM